MFTCNKIYRKPVGVIKPRGLSVSRGTQAIKLSSQKARPVQSPSRSFCLPYPYYNQYTQRSIRPFKSNGLYLILSSLQNYRHLSVRLLTWNPLTWQPNEPHRTRTKTNLWPHHHLVCMSFLKARVLPRYLKLSCQALRTKLPPPPVKIS